MTLRDELEPFASSGREAGRIVDDLFDDIIAALRCDRRFAEIKPHDLELRLADLRTATERLLFDMFRGRIHLDDVDYVAGDGS